MKISIACDHGALALKNALSAHLTAMGHEVVNFGTDSLDSCDCDRGIVLCPTGLGMSIAANKVKGIRCALLSDLTSARLTREHNDTNMMAMGAGVISQELALQIADVWLGTEFSGGERHQRRIDKVMALEK